MNSQETRCKGESLEERIIHNLPKEKALEVKGIVRELFGGDGYVDLKRHKEDVSIFLESGFFDNRNYESRIWIDYIERKNGYPDLIRMAQDSNYDIFCVRLPESATNVFVDIERTTISFVYKGYEISLDWKNRPQVILDSFGYKPLNKEKKYIKEWYPKYMNLK